MTALALLVATPGGDPFVGKLILAGLVVVWLVGYIAACALWPYGYCRRCDGSGKRMSPGGRHFRLCPRCKGSARRLRIGRRVWVYFRGRQSEASK